MERFGSVKPKTTRLINLIVLLGSLCVSALIAELFFSVWNPKPMRVNHRDFYQFDPVLGWNKKVKQERVNKTEEFYAVERTNGKGIRGPDYEYTKSRNEYRILILGDSFAEGYTVAFQDLFSEVLKAKLNSLNDGTYYEVINAGTVGYSTDQELLFFQHEGYKYHPDLVVLMFYQNDVWDNTSVTEMYGKFKPLFGLENNDLVLANIPAAGERPKAIGKGPGSSPGIREWLEKKSHVYRVIEGGLANLRLINSGGLDPSNIPNEFKIWYKGSDPDSEYAWKITEMLIVKLRDSVERRGAKLLLFHVPGLEHVDAQVWEATMRQFGLSATDWDPKIIESRLMRICEDNAIRYISGTVTFMEKAESFGTKPAAFYHLRDRHWNALGHRSAGEILFEGIRLAFLGY